MFAPVRKRFRNARLTVAVYAAAMAYDPGAIDSALAAAVGDDPTLIAELRLAFVESAERALVQVTEAADAVAWEDGLARMRGLAASFGAVRLAAAAHDAAAAEPGDASALKQLRRLVARL